MSGAPRHRRNVVPIVASLDGVEVDFHTVADAILPASRSALRRRLSQSATNLNLLEDAPNWTSSRFDNL